VGPGRYRGRCRYAVTNPDAQSYANTNSDTCCMRGDAIANTYGLSYSYSYSNSDRDSLSYSYSYSYCDTDAYKYGQTYAYRPA
jgi:hypothetical protein